MADYLTVPGAQVTEAERKLIHSLAEKYNTKDSMLVNIGIMWGCTLWCLRSGAPKAKLLGIDLEPQKWKIVDLENLHAEIVAGDSRTFDYEGPIDLLLIDGDHHYETVKADIQHWVPKVVPGGIVIFHDYSPTVHNLRQFPELEGVKRAVNELVREYGLKTISKADSAIAFVKRMTND